jgi:hypothetical protein
MKRISEARVNLAMDKELKELASKVARMRGETLSSLIRRALRRELASLNYLSDEEKKALGIMMLKMKESPLPSPTPSKRRREVRPLHGR